MAHWKKSRFGNPRLVWTLVVLLAVLDIAGVAMLLIRNQEEVSRAERQQAARLLAEAEVAKPKPPPPPAMIHPPAVDSMLRSGTLIVISKPSQTMFVFSDGLLWASAPVSTGKRRHETPSGLYPILQKQRYHRSNIYSGAPMPYMQRLTWEGIALHAGHVPGYPASHGCVRLPPAMAQALFKLTSASATTVVIGDEPMASELEAQQFALSAAARLPIRSALAPPPEPPSMTELAEAAAVPLRTALASVGPVAVSGASSAASPAKAPSLAPPPPPHAGGETIQLAASPSQADAEAHWALLRSARPDIARFEKRVEQATVNSRRVYRLRAWGAGAHGYCAKLRGEGVECLDVG